MKKKRLILCLLGAACLLAACQPQSRDAAQGGDALFGPAESTAATSSLDEATQLRYQVLGKVHDFYQQLGGISLTSQVTTPDGDWSYQTTSQQVYADGGLTAYRTQAKTQVGDQSYDLAYYYDGQHHQVQAPQSAWEQNDNATTSMTYLYWAKLLIEGEEPITVEDSESGQWTVTKTVTTADLTGALPGLLNLPLTLSPQATLAAQLTYQVDTETGQIHSMAMDLTVTDGDQTRTYQATATSQVPESAPTADSLKPDMDATVTALTPAEGQWLTDFQAANPTRAMATYEATEGRQTGDQDENRLWLLNVQGGQVHAAAVGTIQDQAVSSYTYIWQGQAYAKDDAGQVSQTAVTPVDFYDQAVATFVAQYDQVSEFQPETAEGESATPDATSWTYRQTFDNDYDAFAAVAGSVDVSNLQREDQALYGIDYIVNKTSLRLEGVYFWSLTAEETAINYVNRLSFRHLNQQAPALIHYIVDADLLKAAHPAE